MSEVYTTAEVCERFDVHRNTLFRWEKEGRIPEPARNLRGERQYSAEHVQAIARLIQAKRHGQLYAHIVSGNGADSLDQLRQLGESNALFKFVHLHELTGLAELREYVPLQSGTIRELLAYALEQTDPADKLFWEILEIIWQSKIAF